MFLELAKPVTLLASILTLLAVFHAAFLTPEATLEERIYDSLALLALAAAISLLSGLAFQKQRQAVIHLVRVRAMRLTETFPVQVFFWATGIMTALFVLAWYVETYILPYRNVQF
jgi:hypothetical protein